MKRPGIPRSTMAVTVERDGEPVVTIATNELSGRDLSHADVDTIRAAAHQLLAFIGDPLPLTERA